jgi:hypothetical protein
MRRGIFRRPCGIRRGVGHPSARVTGLVVAYPHEDRATPGEGERATEHAHPEREGGPHGNVPVRPTLVTPT